MTETPAARCASPAATSPDLPAGLCLAMAATRMAQPHLQNQPNLDQINRHG